MFRKNIYIVFPAGYMGNYINWIINKSNVLTAKATVNNPITGLGNTHGHVRFPTHMGFDQLVIWIALHKPANKQVYILAADKNSPEWAISRIFRMDKDPVVINIHANNKPDLQKYGALNMIKTWPVRLKAGNRGAWTPFDDPNDLANLHYLLDNWKTYFDFPDPVNKEYLSRTFDSTTKWFDIRHAVSPNEITEDQYIIHRELPDNIYDICIKDIVQPNFINQLAGILAGTDAADFNFNHATKFHPTYLAHRPNAKWFDVLHQFRTKKVIDDWWHEHMLSQAFLLLEMNLPAEWRHMSYKEIVQHYDPKIR